MQGLMAGLLLAIVVMVLSLVVAALGGLGIAAVGLMLSRLFELTQWQGSLIGLGVALGVGYVLTQLATPAAPSPTQGELPAQRPAKRTK